MRGPEQFKSPNRRKRLLGVMGGAVLALVVATASQKYEAPQKPEKPVPTLVEGEKRAREEIASSIGVTRTDVLRAVSKQVATERQQDAEPPDDKKVREEAILDDVMPHLMGMSNFREDAYEALLDLPTVEERKRAIMELVKRKIFYSEMHTDSCGNRFIEIVRGTRSIAKVTADSDSGTVTIDFGDASWFTPWPVDFYRGNYPNSRIFISGLEPVQIPQILREYDDLSQRYRRAYNTMFVRFAGESGIEVGSLEEKQYHDETLELLGQFYEEARRIFGQYGRSVGPAPPDCDRTFYDDEGG